MQSRLLLSLNRALIEFTVFYRDAQALVWIGDQIDVLERIAIDEQ
jgi:hypothetical protein